MARLAIIDNATNKVVNIAEADEINPIEGMICVFSDTADIGDDFDGNDFIKSAKVITLADRQSTARTRLTVSDMAAVRCFKAGIPYPAEWQEYDAVLRQIVNGDDLTLPVQPAYPEST